MSSLKSRAVPTFAEHEAALRAAVGEVAENSFFAFASSSDTEQFAEAVRHPPVFDPDQPPQPPVWLTTTVRFRGAFAGQMEVAMPDALAQQLLGAFLGLAGDEPIAESQVVDSTGEFANQVCGNWLTRACQRRRFDLEPPRVERKPASWLPLDAPPAGAHDGDVLVSLNDFPLRLRVHFESEAER